MDTTYMNALLLVGLCLSFLKQRASAQRQYEPYSVTEKDFRHFFPDSGGNSQHNGGFHLQPQFSYDDIPAGPEALKPRRPKPDDGDGDGDIDEDIDDDKDEADDGGEEAGEFKFELDDEMPDSSKEDKEGEALRKELGLGEYWRDSSDPHPNLMSPNQQSSTGEDIDSFERESRDDFDENDAPKSLQKHFNGQHFGQINSNPNPNSEFRPSPSFNPESSDGGPNFDSGFRPSPDFYPIPRRKPKMNSDPNFKPGPSFNPDPNFAFRAFHGDGFAPAKRGANQPQQTSVRGTNQPVSVRQSQQTTVKGGNQPFFHQPLQTTIRVGNQYVVHGPNAGRQRQFVIRRRPVGHDSAVILRNSPNNGGEPTQSSPPSNQQTPKNGGGTNQHKPKTTTTITKSVPEYVYHSVEEYDPRIYRPPLIPEIPELPSRRPEIAAPEAAPRPELFKPFDAFEPTPSTPPYPFEIPNDGFDDFPKSRPVIGFRNNGIKSLNVPPPTVATPVRSPIRPFTFKQVNQRPNYYGPSFTSPDRPYRLNHDEEPTPIHKPNYKYHYFVNDPHTRDVKSQWELRDGDLVNGAYSLIEPDGALRVVEYTADPENGFRALVKRIVQNQHGEDIEERMHHG